MKAIFVFIILWGLCFGAKAQSSFFSGDDLNYAVIKDTDKYVNIREDPNSHSAILGRINKYNVFSCQTNKSNWWKVLCIEYDSNHKPFWLQGFIHKSRVSFLTKWMTIKKENVYNDSCVFKNDDLIAVVKKTSFISNKHKIIKKSQDLLLIDGKGFWGTDGEIPKSSISKLRLIIKGKSIIIPNNAFNDLYEPRFKTLSICFGPENTIYVSMSNSDGAGAYTIIWIFKDNKYFSRYIDDSMV
jgi:hypothetical protein